MGPEVDVRRQNVVKCGPLTGIREQGINLNVKVVLHALSQGWPSGGGGFQQEKLATRMHG